MTKTELKSFRQRLLAMRQRLTGEVSQLRDEALQKTGGERGGGLSNMPLHLADLGNSQYEEEVTLDLVGNEERILADVEAALERIDRGIYDQCQECLGKISRERLEALPYTRHCVDCARKLQQEGA